MTNFYPKKGALIYGRYKVIDILGSGATAIVLLCHDQATNKKVVLKRFYQDKLLPKMVERVYQEPECKIQSEYLVMGYDAFKEEYLHLVMPYIDGMCLSNLLEINEIDEANAAYIIICLLKAADALHQAGFIATDIKPDNVIISVDGTPKLIDFTCREKSNSIPELSLGTSPYAAPELLNRNYISPETDVFSIGITFFEMLSGHEVFDNIRDSLTSSIKAGQKPDISFIMSRYPKSAAIISQAVEPNRRLSIKNFLSQLTSYYQSLLGISRVILQCRNGKQLCIKPGRTTIGRKLLDPLNLYVSENHFDLYFDGTTLKIMDLKSRNGTKINGRSIDGNWIDLHHTDIIQLPNLELTVNMANV